MSTKFEIDPHKSASRQQSDRENGDRRVSRLVPPSCTFPSGLRRFQAATLSKLGHRLKQ
jgi:hypothetical protein